MLAVDGGFLRLCDWVDSHRFGCHVERLRRDVGLKGDGDDGRVMELVRGQLDEYFAGRRWEFDIALNPVGSEFGRLVWRELLGVGYGERLSYSELAERMGMRRSVRAVATAVADNPISVIVPCHRIVGADGGLRGYAGGIEAKRGLLALESAL